MTSIKKEYSDLSVSQLNSSFMVVSRLASDTQLTIDNCTFLKVNDTYFFKTSDRNDVADFISHICDQTKRILQEIFNNITSGKDTDESITILHTLHKNLICFVDKFDYVINYYYSDSLIKSRLQDLKTKFIGIEDNFYRKIILMNNK